MQRALVLIALISCTAADILAKDSAAAADTNHKCPPVPAYPESPFTKLRNCVKSAHPSIIIEFPGDQAFLNSTIPANQEFQIKAPWAVIKPRNTAETATAVSCTRSFTERRKIVLRSDASDLSGYEYGSYNGEVVIDLRLLNEIKIWGDSGLAEVGGGVRADVLAEQAYAAGLWTYPLPLGASSTIGPFIQDGGFGYLARAFGLAADHVYEFEIVRGDGSITQVRNHDAIYWALRGGGRNYGIVTKAKIQLKKVNPIATFVRITNTAQQTELVLKSLRDYLSGAPSQLTPIVKIIEGRVIVEAIYLGNQIQAKQALAAFTDRLSCEGATFEEGTFIEIVRKALKSDGFSDKPAGNYYFEKALPVAWTDHKPLSDQCIGIIANAAIEKTHSSIAIRLEAWGGPASQIRAIKDSDSGFSLRDLQINGLVALHSLSPFSFSDIFKLETLWGQIRACASDRVYVGYRAKELGEDYIDQHGNIVGDGPRALKQYHGDHYDYLSVAHANVDPENTFWYPQAFRISKNSQ